MGEKLPLSSYVLHRMSLNTAAKHGTTHLSNGPCCSCCPPHFLPPSSSHPSLLSSFANRCRLSSIIPLRQRKGRSSESARQKSKSKVHKRNKLALSSSFSSPLRKTFKTPKLLPCSSHFTMRLFSCCFWLFFIVLVFYGFPLPFARSCTRSIQLLLLLEWSRKRIVDGWSSLSQSVRQASSHEVSQSVNQLRSFL